MRDYSYSMPQIDLTSLPVSGRQKTFLKHVSMQLDRVCGFENDSAIA